MQPKLTKREEILQASLALIMEKGLYELTTAKIARKINTSENTLYRHFTSKHEIITELLQRVAADFTAKATVIASSSASPAEKLSEMTLFHLNFMQQTKGVSRIIFSEQVHLAQPQDPFKIAARSLAHNYRSCIMKVISEGVEKDFFSKHLDVETASMSYLGLHYFLLHEWALDDYSWNLTEKKDQILAHFEQAWTK